MGQIMGGFGSGGHNRKRRSVEACARLDAAMLRRAGVFDAVRMGTRHAWRYRSGGSLTAALSVEWAPGAAALLVMTRCDGVGLVARVAVSYTACNYGRRRTWLHCPACGRRAFRLFHDPHGAPGVPWLACRQCAGLTYAQWQGGAMDKALSTMHAIRDKLVALGGQDWGDWHALPTKPARMRWRTFDRLARRWRDARGDVMATLAGRLANYGEMSH